MNQTYSSNIHFDSRKLLLNFTYQRSFSKKNNTEVCIYTLRKKGANKGAKEFAPFT